MGKIMPSGLEALARKTQAVIKSREERDSYLKVYGRRAPFAVNKRAAVRYHEKALVDLAILLFEEVAIHEKR